MSVRVAWRPALAAAALALAVVAVYAPVRDFPFVVFDDKAYVSENPHVVTGLSREGVRWAFTGQAQGNYVPLSWLSHMLDVELFGLDAGRHHLMNLLLHLASALLLFETLRRASGALAPSAFTAAVFAIHPAHVESVAWVSERRDVLSGLFWMLALAAHVAWARSGRRRHRALLVAAFALGLLAKAMLVTLPFVLLLLDYWPLRRGGEGWRRLLLEKLPLFALAGLAALLVLFTQGAVGAVVTLDQLPLSTRLANALVSAVVYLRVTLWPVELAVFYPYALDIPPWKVASATALLSLLTAGACWQARRRPWLLVGWLWYGVTLLPVIGLVQVGSQGMADRYTYLPMIGLAIALGWQGAELANRHPTVRGLLGAAALVWLVVCALLAHVQVDTWRSSEALFEHAHRVTGDNYVVHANLGEAYDDAGDAERALAHYERALEIFPEGKRIDLAAGRLRADRGELEAASRHFQRAVTLHPEAAGARLELGVLLLQAGRPEEAARWLEEERAVDPESARALLHLGEVAALAGDGERARERFAAAFTLDPELPDEPALDRNAAVARALSAALAGRGRQERAAFWAQRAAVLEQLGGA